MAPFFQGYSICSNPKEELKRKAHDLKNQDPSQGSSQGSNSMVQFASKESKLVPRTLEPGPHLK